MGAHHGRFGLDAFSHERGVFQQSPLDLSPTLLTLPGGVVRTVLAVLVGGRRRRPRE